MPKISIILPFFNADTNFDRALTSMVNQTYKDFECILVNNNSTDKSVAIATEFCNKDARFQLLHEPKKGVVHAHNLGLENARGKYVARMDADDWSFPERLSMQVAFLEKNIDCDVVAGMAEYVPHKSDTLGFERYVNWSNGITDFKDIYTKQFIESPFINPTVMWRKSVSDRYGSYEEGDFPEDYELWLRWLANGVKFYKLFTNLLKWYDSESRLTRVDPKYSDEAFFKIKTKYLSVWLKSHNPFYPKVVVWGASKISRKRAKVLEDHGIVVTGYIDISAKRQIEKKIIYYKNIRTPLEIFILVYLKEETMRSDTQHFLEGKGFVEGVNYLLVS